MTDPHAMHSYGMGTPMKLMPKYLDIMAAQSTLISITGRGGERFLSHPYAIKLPYAMRCHDFLIANLGILQFFPQWLLVVLSYILGYIDGTDIFNATRL